MNSLTDEVHHTVFAPVHALVGIQVKLHSRHRGKTTVPMSRPSITIPPRSPICCCSDHKMRTNLFIIRDR